MTTLTGTTWYTRPATRGGRPPEAPPPEIAAFHRTLPGYAPTPLVELPSLAAELGVRRLFVKDESSRFGLPAFKMLGASWGAFRALSRHYGVPLADATLGRLRARTGERPVRLVTATEGNHGRAVAAMARMLGARARVYVPSGVHPAAVAAIEGEGAEVAAVAGSYEEAVGRAADAATAPDTLLVQDTSVPGHDQVPQWIVDGYSTLFTEIDDELSARGVEPPSLVAVPVGVGSLAQAAVAHYGRTSPPAALLTVEPDAAPCLLASLAAGRRTTIATRTTIMSGLHCATPSALAWPHLRERVDAAVAVSDGDTVRAARDLAARGVHAGPCGAASLAGVRAALAPGRRAALPRGHDRTVVLLGTEGAAANPLP
ncbi:pyridoxal-phosphate dependent enzyme [Actinomadura sp. WMMB 499]|uniref:pyridoxal-phosphate dependent enzyme n=1 Tax=Actinomadura sp. WMMB 499 TaxID=1219491 RepID=UPI0012445347|nr:pyridoxal-phosphate dependent enzyme [Actinomadura sp. WMMB 499]QFG23266.1 pyridoxal-phosphate dependent enzyme [Actinomadura sp. WMMB 499]